DRAIQRGVVFLKNSQRADGSWSGGSSCADFMGPTALAGLTLLECGVDRKDFPVQKAAEYVRAQASVNAQTYSVAVAILFLARLADSADILLIQKLAYRLIAGQKACGGWDYPCPFLKDNEQAELAQLLEAATPDLNAAQTGVKNLPVWQYQRGQNITWR